MQSVPASSLQEAIKNETFAMETDKTEATPLAITFTVDLARVTPSAQEKF